MVAIRTLRITFEKSKSSDSERSTKKRIKKKSRKE